MALYHQYVSYKPTYGYLWIFMDSYGYLWIFMDIYGYLWIFLDIYTTFRFGPCNKKDKARDLGDLAGRA